MARFSYNASTAMGQMLAEGINDLQNGFAKLTRISKSVALMDEAQAASEMGINAEQFAGFRSGLNQLRTTLEADPFAKLLPNYDQG